MKQAGRKSAAQLATVATLPARKIPPPSDLSEAEGLVWVEVMSTKPASWWDAGSLPLLAQYCRVTVEATRVGELVRSEAEFLDTKKADLKQYARLRRMQGAISRELVALATKLRLTQQSRYDAKSANTASQHAGTVAKKRPWDA